MARIYPLFSSSDGNAEFIGTEKGGILIDCGVSYKKLRESFEIHNIPLSAVRGIFITHEHSDHVAGLKMFTKYNNVTVYGQKYTLQNLCAKGHISPETKLIDITGRTVPCGDCEVMCFDTPHDTVQSCGYKVRTYDNKLCAVCTDLGHITETVADALKGCRLVMIESNYDTDMLANSVYPLPVKRRIMSDNGHLSNDVCGRQVQKLISQGTTHILLGHISQKNNTPQLAYNTVSGYLRDYKAGTDYLMAVAPVRSEGVTVIF